MAIKNLKKILDHCKPLSIFTKILVLINLYSYDVLIFINENENAFILRNKIHSQEARNTCKLNVISLN